MRSRLRTGLVVACLTSLLTSFSAFAWALFTDPRQVPHQKPAITLAAPHRTEPTEAPASTVASARDRSWPDAGEVFVVGDSLTVGASPWLEEALAARGWRLTKVDARVGRPVAEGLAILATQRHRLPGTVVVALGTNDLSATSADVEEWMETARRIVGDRRIVWINLCLDEAASTRLSAFRRINTALTSGSHSFQVEVADWCHFANTSGIDTAADGIHYAPPDYRLRAEFYAEALTQAISP